MLFLITNQSNCFTLFVLKLGGDTTINLIKKNQKVLIESFNKVKNGQKITTLKFK